MRVQFVPAQGDPGWELAGISVGERTRLALAKAGLAAERPGASDEQLWIAADALLEPGAARALAGAAADSAESADSADSDSGLALAAAGDAELPAALRVPSDARAPTHADDFVALVDRFRSQGRLRLVDTGGARCCRIRSAADARRVEGEMLASMIRPTDGFFARTRNPNYLGEMLI